MSVRCLRNQKFYKYQKADDVPIKVREQVDQAHHQQQDAGTGVQGDCRLSDRLGG